MSIDPGVAHHSAVTKQILRISMARLLELTGELARERGARIPVDTNGAPSAVVPIREASSGRPPLILVHPVGGSIVAYYQLVRYLPPDQPVYAIENQVAFNRHARLHATVEEMATHYLEATEAARGGGPCLFGGYSMGGLVAFEMARQVEAASGQRPRVAIVDTPARTPEVAGADRQELTVHDLTTMAAIMSERLETNVPLDSRKLERLDPDARLEYVVEAFRSAGIIAPELDIDVFRRLVVTVKNNDGAQRRYRPQRYGGPVDLLRAEQGQASLGDEAGPLDASAALGWQEVCTQPVDVSYVPGAHLQLMVHPYVVAVAGWLQERVDRSLST